MLTRRGFEVQHVPLVALNGTGASAPEGIPDEVLVTSAAVARFVPNLAEHISGAKVFAVGPATAGALGEIGVDVFHVGAAGGLASLSQLRAEGVRWYVGAEEPSSELAKGLEALGVYHWPVYRTSRLDGTASLMAIDVDAVCFTSGSAATSFYEAAGTPQCDVFTIGSTTTSVASQLGMSVTSVAKSPTLASLAATVEQFFSHQARGLEPQ